MGWQNIVEAGGLALAGAGMTVVFAGLLLVSLFIAALPRVMALLDHPGGTRVGLPVPLAGSDALSPADDPALLAAIAYVIRREVEAEQALDHQQITIRHREGEEMWTIVGKMRTLSTRI